MRKKDLKSIRAKYRKADSPAERYDAGATDYGQGYEQGYIEGPASDSHSEQPDNEDYEEGRAEGAEAGEIYIDRIHRHDAGARLDSEGLPYSRPKLVRNRGENSLKSIRAKYARTKAGPHDRSERPQRGYEEGFSAGFNEPTARPDDYREYLNRRPEVDDYVTEGVLEGSEARRLSGDDPHDAVDSEGRFRHGPGTGGDY